MPGDAAPVENSDLRKVNSGQTLSGQQICLSSRAWPLAAPRKRPRRIDIGRAKP
jgi:hypothetical protein